MTWSFLRFFYYINCILLMKMGNIHAAFVTSECYLMSRTRISHIFIMPLLILLYASWQYWRITDTIDITNLYSFATNGILHVRLVLAISGLLLSCGALSIIICAVLLCTLSARHSRASVEQLISRFTLCQRRLP